MILVDETHAVMGPEELRALPEYSRSVPTGTTTGRRWKRALYDARLEHRTGDWLMGEYGEPMEDPRGARFGQVVPICWREILVVTP